MRKINDDELLKLYNRGKGMAQKELAAHFGVSPAAICQRLKYLKAFEAPESFDALTKKEKRFALAVAEGSNQSEAAMAAFDCNGRDSAKAIGSTLMRKPEMQMAITDLLSESGLTRRYRLKKLKQCIDAKDPSVVLKGLDQSWKLDGLYGEGQNVNIAITGEEIREMRDMALKLMEHPLYDPNWTPDEPEEKQD